MEENPKKVYRKVKRKDTGLWKGISILSAVFTIVMIAATILTSVFDNTLAIFMGGTFWELEKDTQAVYYDLDFETAEDMEAYGEWLCEEVEAEGAVLLMNENEALPLKEGEKVSLFSNSSVNLVYGGTGSGNVDTSTANTLKDALEYVHIEVNQTLWDFYLQDAAEYLRELDSVVVKNAAEISECPWDIYTEKVIQSVDSYGDAAIVTISRIGGEGYDLTFENFNYLALDEKEKELMKHLKERKEEGIVKKIIVLINSANPLQVDFLKENEYGIDACLWIGDVGITGIDAVSKILVGQINPSGSLADTYCYDNYSSPAMKNNVPTVYEGYEEGVVLEQASTYIIYQEGIYVGYRYYETRYEDTVMGTGNTQGYQYGDEVAFPFGFGLSYTTFLYSDMEVCYHDNTDQFEISIKVTNTGEKYSGKETVQIYLQSPYTQYDKEHQLEKASVELCGFGKTKMLAPFESQILTIYVDKKECTSYDAYGKETYLLEAGDYYFTAATDAHQAVNHILAAKGYTIENTEGRMDKEGNAALTYKWTNEKLDAKTYAISTNGTTITNQLSDSDINLTDSLEGQTITYLSRSDWNGTFPTEIVRLRLTECLIDLCQEVRYNAQDYESMQMPTLGADNGLKLVDMIGLSYDDPKWEYLLDQMTFSEMVSLIGDSFHWTMPIESIQAPGTRGENGPQGLTTLLFRAGEKEANSNINATAFPSEDIMAATFNTDLMYDIGWVIANNCIDSEITCLYGPGVNMHRTPYGGRNFEYFSEDPFLSGKMCAKEVQALREKGIFVTLKHFILNDSEQDRIGLGIWLNEQSAREIYLKAFQIPVEEADAGLMVAYTRLGAVWSGGNYPLMTNIVRGEWGKIGFIITDNVLTGYVNGADGMTAGGVSAYDAMLPFVTMQLSKYKNDPFMVTAMREACHQTLYSIANSAAMNGITSDTVIKRKELVIVKISQACAAVFGLLFLVSLFLWLRKRQKFMQTQIYIDYQEWKKMKKNRRRKK